MKLPLIAAFAALSNLSQSSAAFTARALLFLALVLVGGAATLDCGPRPGPADPSANDKAVIEGKDLACVMGSLISDSKELQAVCKFADAVLPFVQGLIGVRDAARRSGVSYQPSPQPERAVHGPAAQGLAARDQDGGGPPSAAKVAPDQKK